MEFTKEQIADIKKSFRMFPIELEPRISTLSKPLIIISACPGWQSRYWGPPEVYPIMPPGYKEGELRYPAVPWSIEEQARADIEAMKAGAAGLHHHPRDPETGVGKSMASNGVLLKTQAYDLVFEELDAITIDHTWLLTSDHSIDYITHAKENLELGKGNKYCQGALIMWPPGISYPDNYEKAVQDGVNFMEENHIKPVHKVRSALHLRELKRLLIDKGVKMRKPLIIAHDMGHPNGWPMDIDPWMPIDLISALEQTKERIPGCVLSVEVGGRNWLPILITAILAGVDMVRVGMEDCFWMYPHKEDIIQSNLEIIKKTVDFCRLIGREIASTIEAREILGIERTST